MVDVRNAEALAAIRKAAQLQVLGDKVPLRLSETVAPVMEMNPELLRRCNVVANTSRSTTGTSTVYTVPSDKDFFLTSAQMSASYDATADSTNSFLTVTLDDGASSARPLQLMKQTTTASSLTQGLSFVPPIKLKRGTTVGLNLSFSVGSGNGSANITGYTVENPNS